MCILFFTVDDNPGKRGYKLILANNRDEMWDRPTKPAAFWEDNPECISGGLVCDYIAGETDAISYIQQLNHQDYNAFNLVLMDIGITEPSRIFYTTNYDDNLKLEPFPPGTYGFGNSKLNKCWKKVQDGKEIFSNIVKNYGTSDNKIDLLDSLIKLLSDKSQYLPDPHLEEQGRTLKGSLKNERSAIFVFSPEFRCGTSWDTRFTASIPSDHAKYTDEAIVKARLPEKRTQTIILIDSEGNCEYIEKTLKDPVVEDNLEWITSNYTFQLKERPSWEWK